ncbi:MAG: hypothetical protein ACLRZN_08215 [Dialister invisus]
MIYRQLDDNGDYILDTEACVFGRWMQWHSHQDPPLYCIENGGKI